MGLGWRSVLLVYLVVIGSLFTLLYSSQVIANEKEDQFYKLLEGKKADATIFLFKEPQVPCFTVSSSQLEKYEFLVELMDQADFNAELDPPDQSDRYSGFATGVNSEMATAFVREHQSVLNHTSQIVDVREGYSDDKHSYSCNIQYSGKHYRLTFEFKSLTALGQYRGFIPVGISEDGLDVKERYMEPRSHIMQSRPAASPRDVPVYYTFNNTAVWTNNARQWVHLTLTQESSEGDYTVEGKIPPGNSWDYGLRPVFSSAEPTVYRYSAALEDGNTFDGSFVVKYYPTCMTMDEARSLYSQNEFAMRFPSYLPDDYRYLCGIHFDDFMMIQAYWNRPAEAVTEFEGYTRFQDFAYSGNALQNEVVQIFAIKKGGIAHEEVDKTAEERFEELRNQNEQTHEIKFVAIKEGVAAVTYAREQLLGSDLHIMEVYDPANEEGYVIRTMMDFDELTKIGKSLYLD